MSADRIARLIDSKWNTAFGQVGGGQADRAGTDDRNVQRVPHGSPSSPARPAHAVDLQTDGTTKGLELAGGYFELHCPTAPSSRSGRSLIECNLGQHVSSGE
jgi:hypothetical protein